MGYKIGMDFGTTNSTVAWINDKSGEPEAFKYPGLSGYEYIPSCVAYYEEEHIAIGRSAYEWADTGEAVFCDNLKMVLPMPSSQRLETTCTR